MPYTVTPQNAGASAADPLLKGLKFEWFDGASTIDVASIVDAWLDSASSPNTNSVKVSLSPAPTVTTNGTAGAYVGATKRLTIASTTGLSVGDYLIVSHPSVTGGAAQFGKIASIPVAGAVTLVGDPLGSSDLTNVSYQVAWRYQFIAGTAPSVSSAGGSANYTKFQGADSAGNSLVTTNVFYVADAPAGAAFVSINGQSSQAASGNTATPALNILSGWTNRGGVATVELLNHSTQARNDFKFSDGTVAEKVIAGALGTLQLTAGDGTKYGKLRLRAFPGSPTYVDVDLQYTQDTTAPTILMGLAGA